MAFKWLEPDEKPEVFWHSSISQDKHTLSVLKRGEWVPISFDSLDYITCANDKEICSGLKTVSHCAILTDGPDIGYHFGVGECKYISKTVFTHDHVGIETKALPAWMGEGTYDTYVENEAFINANCETLGLAQETNLRVGTAYALARKTLPSDDR